MQDARDSEKVFVKTNSLSVCSDERKLKASAIGGGGLAEQIPSGTRSLKLLLTKQSERCEKLEPALMNQTGKRAVMNKNLRI
jgi:hypothetical protein